MFPPAAGANDVKPAVAVYVANPQAVRIPLRARNLLARLTRYTDRVHFPELGGILARSEPGHLSHVFFSRRLPAHDQNLLARAEQVDILGRFVTGAGPNDVLFPVPLFAPRILIPISRLPRKTDHDLIGPAVAVDVVRPTEHAFAITRETVAIVTDLANFVHLPIRRLIPNVPAEDVHFAVFIDVSDSHSLRTEFLVDHGLLPRNGRGFIEGDAFMAITGSPFEPHQWKRKCGSR